MVYVFLAPGFEITEAMTPIDYLRRAELDVRTVAVTGCEDKMVFSSHKIPVIADITEAEVCMDGCQMVVLPGGMPGTLNLEASKTVQNAVDYCAEHQLPIGAICAAPSILGHKGLLDGKKATCYPGFETELGGAVYTAAEVETVGNITTARAAGTANQFAFSLIEQVCGKEKADEVMKSVVY